MESRGSEYWYLLSSSSRATSWHQEEFRSGQEHPSCWTLQLPPPSAPGLGRPDLQPLAAEEALTLPQQRLLLRDRPWVCTVTGITSQAADTAPHGAKLFPAKFRLQTDGTASLDAVSAPKVDTLALLICSWHRGHTQNQPARGRELAAKAGALSTSALPELDVGWTGIWEEVEEKEAMHGPPSSESRCCQVSADELEAEGSLTLTIRAKYSPPR